MSVDFKKSKHVFISSNKCRHLTSLITALFQKCTTYFLVQSPHEEKRVNGLPLLNMKVTLLTFFFFLHSMVNRCKNPEITLWPDLNLTVGLDISFS